MSNISMFDIIIFTCKIISNISVRFCSTFSTVMRFFELALGGWLLVKPGSEVKMFGLNYAMSL